jgi:hypothetical protein
MKPQSDDYASLTPNLARLLARYLDRPHLRGESASSDAGEVIPHDAAVGFPLDVDDAWADTRMVLDARSPERLVPQAFADAVPVLPHWHALPMAAGHFAQQVADMQPFLNTPQLTDLYAADLAREIRPPEATLHAVQALLTSNDSELQIIAWGLLRQWRLSPPDQPAASADWINANERAASAWLRGEANTAQAMWNQAEPVPAVLFNRGMAALFTGAIPAAIPALTAAMEVLSEESGWHHLAGFYRAAAEMRQG